MSMLSWSCGMVELEVFFYLETGLIAISMIFFQHKSVCLPFVHNDFVLIYLLKTVTAFGISSVDLVTDY